MSPPPSLSGIFSCVVKKLGGKAKWLALTLIFIICLSSPQKANAQSNSCNADSACSSWSGWFISSDSVPIAINGDTCYITFGYKWRVCTSPHKMQISTTSFNFPDSSCGFGPYLDSLYNVNSPDVWVITENIRGQADRKLGELNFLRYRANNPQFSFNCSFQSGCASLSGFFEVVSYYAECIEFIAVGAPGGGVSAGCPGISYIVECSSSDCCILSRKMCYDSGTGTVRICETVSAGSGSSNCTGNATFTVPTGCSIFHRSGCRNVTCP